MKRSEIPRSSGAVVGCYDLHLYCQHPTHESDASREFWHNQTNPACRFNPGEFTGRSEAHVLRTARRNGWWISTRNEDGERAVLCPFHAREVPR
jgi:hypothetical protein